MFLKALKKLMPSRNRPVFELPPPERADARDIERSFARLFVTDDGKRVLAFLNGMTFMRAAGIDVTDDALRYMEGQRALLASILRMIERGRGL